MLSGVGDGKEYIVDLIRKSNNRKIDHVYAYPEDKTGKLFQSVVENITVNNPIIIHQSFLLKSVLITQQQELV